MPESGENGVSKVEDKEDESPTLPESEIHFEPIVNLPLVDVPTNEEDEEELIKLRAKLYRFDTSDDGPGEWKERGTGEVKLLRHKIKHTVRIVMRRDKTLKVCANHFVWPWMELKPSFGSDKAWLWSALADFADEAPKPQLLAIKFANPENAQLWKEAFEKAKKIVHTECEAYIGKPGSDDSDDESEDSESEYDSTQEQIKDESPTSPRLDSKNETTEKELNKSSNSESTDDVAKELENLKVKDQE